MALNDLLSDVYSRFKEASEPARVTLIHSSSRYRTALISRLLADPNEHVFYYAMDTDDVDVRSFMAGFTHDMAEQFPSFGAHINRVGLENLDDLNPLLEAFLEDLQELSSEPYILLFDEFDRAEVSDDLEMFLEAAIENLPSQCRVIISGRGLPRLPWMSLIAQRKAVMLHDADQVSEDFYANQAKGKARLEISGLGPGNVLLDGDVVDSWEGHLPRLLFFFALERPFVTRSEICQAFWPELNNEQAVNVFHVTKRRLHKALESLGVDVLVHENGYYRVNPDLSIHYDLVDFVGSLVEGRSSTEPTKRMTAWQRAIDLHQRPFLQGHSEEWIVNRRNEYQAGYIEALSGMAQVRMHEGRAEHALSLLQRAAGEDESRQDIHRQIMQLYSDLGRRSEAASHYRRLQEILKEHNMPMQEETKSLFEELMAQ